MVTNQESLRGLNRLRGCKTVIVGIGNTLKGDDGAGPLVCQQLRRTGISAELIDAGTVPENYIEPIIEKAPLKLVIIDAVDFRESAGTINVFKPDQLASLGISTHALSPRLFVDMICSRLEVDVYFVGIQPGQLGFGQSVSAQVSQAVQELSDAFAEIFPPRG